MAQLDRAAPPKGQVAGSNPAGVANKDVLVNIFLIGHQTQLPVRAETKNQLLLFYLLELRLDDKIVERILNVFPNFLLEKDLIHSGYSIIAGVDEVGRGPLAGPVTAAAVILDPLNIPDNLNDSKLLSLKQKRKNIRRAYV